MKEVPKHDARRFRHVTSYRPLGVVSISSRDQRDGSETQTLIYGYKNPREHQVSDDLKRLLPQQRRKFSHGNVLGNQKLRLACWRVVRGGRNRLEQNLALLLSPPIDYINQILAPFRQQIPSFKMLKI